MKNAHLHQQLAFVQELDQLKSVLRQTRVKSSDNRQENSAEHSWHIAMMATVLVEHATQPVDLNRVIRMLLVHDIVEIDAGDTFCFDEQAVEMQAEKEEQAAQRLFGLLPELQAQEMLTLWHEFEAVETADARYAKAIDCIQPFFQNFHNNGGSWRFHTVTVAQVLKRQKLLPEVAPGIWEIVEPMIQEAADKGWLKP